MKTSRTALIALIFIIQSIATQCLAFTISFTGTMTSTPPDGVTDVNGSVTVTVDVREIVVMGLDAGENHDGAQPTIEYRWNVGKYAGDGPPAMASQDATGNTITLSDGQNGIDGPGRYRVSCDIMARIRINGQDHYADDGWAFVAERDVSFVAVGSLSCGDEATLVATQGNTSIFRLPVGYNGGTATVTALPNPTGAWPTGKPVWSGDIISSDGSTATVDTSTPGVKTVTATCGNAKTIKICVASLDIRADVNHDGSITDADNAIVNGAELEETTPGLILTVPSADDIATNNEACYAEVQIIPKGLAELAALLPDGGTTPQVMIEYEADVLELFTAKNKTNRIASGTALELNAATTIYARGVSATSLAKGKKFITVKLASPKIDALSDQVAVTVLDIKPSMANGGYLLVNDDNDDMLVYPPGATPIDKRKPANIEKDLDQEEPQNWEDDDLQFATFPFAASQLGTAISSCTVSFSVEGNGGAHVYSNPKKDIQVLGRQNAPVFSVSSANGGFRISTSPNYTIPFDTNANGLKLAVEGTARSTSLKGTRLVATWKVNQVEMRAVLPLTVLQMQMAVDGGKGRTTALDSGGNANQLDFTDFGVIDSDGDFGNYSCVFWTNTDNDTKYYEIDNLDKNDWHEDDNSSQHNGATTPNCNDNRIGARGCRRIVTHSHDNGRVVDYIPPPDELNYCLRDLEDFNRLQLILDPLFAQLPGVSFYIGGASINLFEACFLSTSYLCNKNHANKQVVKECILKVDSTTFSKMLNDKLRMDGSITPFIWEGREVGDNWLSFRAELSSKVIGTRMVRISLSEISDFFDSWPKELYASSGSFIRKDNTFKLGQTSDNYFLFVHGYNVNDDEKKSWPATVYKRLWWQGFRGRLGFFSWDCERVSLNIRTYDNSDKKAWEAGKTLASVLEYLQDDASYCKGKVHMLAHSQGNVVAGEGLRRLSASKRIKTYIASQAAISSSCYKVINDAYFEHDSSIYEGHTTPDVRAKFPGWNAEAKPYLESIRDNGRAEFMFNFYNTEDFALHTVWLGSWEQNNKMRPDVFYDYAGDKDIYEGAQTYKGFYHGTSLTVDNKLHLPSVSDPITEVRDAPEIFSYAAEAWGKPIGTLPKNNSNPDLTFDLFNDSIDLTDNEYKYDKHHYSHSRQFRSNIIMEWNYWSTVLNKCLRQ